MSTGTTFGPQFNYLPTQTPQITIPKGALNIPTSPGGPASGAAA